MSSATLPATFSPLLYHSFPSLYYLLFYSSLVFFFLTGKQISMLLVVSHSFFLFSDDSQISAFSSTHPPVFLSLSITTFSRTGTSYIHPSRVAYTSIIFRYFFRPTLGSSFVYSFRLVLTLCQTLALVVTHLTCYSVLGFDVTRTMR